MLLVDFKNLNYLFCIHGRHGSNSFKDFANFLGDHKIIGPNELSEDHLTRKIICITRDPKEKFLSGLDHFFKDLWDPRFLPEELAKPWRRQHSDLHTADLQEFNKYLLTKSFWLTNMSLIKNTTTQLNVSRPIFNNNGTIPFDTITWLFELFFKRTANYHLCDAHMAFTNLSLICMLASDLDVVILDTKDLNTFYASHGYKDTHQTNIGRYSVDPTKQKNYDKNWEIFLEVIDNANWYSKTHCGSEEFKKLMEMEYKAYHAVTSMDKTDESIHFIKDLAWRMISRPPRDYTPLLEVSYLNMSSLVMEVPIKFHRMSANMDTNTNTGKDIILNFLYQIMGKSQYNHQVLKNVHEHFSLST